MELRTNWAGNYRYRARRIHAPSSLDELAEIVATAPRIRALGSRHSFTGIADSDELVTVDALPRAIDVDTAAQTVRVAGAVRYGDVAGELARHGMALPNMASLPHIAVAGAVCTATHGSGDRNGNLATSVAALELLCSDGTLRKFSRSDPEFDGMVVSLGALGVITALTLELVPDYLVRQRVYEGMSWPALTENFDAVTGAGYSVSVFSRWGEATEHVWVKNRVGSEPEVELKELFGARAALGNVHAIYGLDPVHCTPQLGEPGPWSERLPHFRMGFTPSSGAEIQSEYLLDRRHAVPAIEAVLRLAPAIRQLVQVSEIRTIAADSLWMSPQYGRDTVGIHFTWAPRPAEVERALAEVERALAPYEPRPHWGKVFLAGASTIAPRYDRLPDFVGLLGRLDSRRAFSNDWLTARVLGS